MDNFNTCNRDSLPEDAWKDSFDKLLDDKSVLREKNIIKQDVRSSFNMNSSYENSCYINSSSYISEKESKPLAKIKKPLIQKTRSNNVVHRANNKMDSVSTPVSSAKIPFECTLSPIGNWKYRHFHNTVREGAESTKCSTTQSIQNVVDGDMEVSSLTPKTDNLKMFPSADESLTLFLKSYPFKRKLKNVCFDDNINPNVPNINSQCETVKSNCLFSLLPGKWRKSLNLMRRTQSTPSDNTCSHENVDDNLVAINVAGHRKSTLNRKHSDKNNFKRQLLRRCTQDFVVAFEDAYNTDYLKNCCKIGEGAFGEVFLYTKPEGRDPDKTVLKIIPIEGKELINGEVQKSFEQILQEVVISKELCAFKECESSNTTGFVNIEKVKCVKGKYPVLLQKLWQEYDDRKKSENDHPECFSNRQLYIVLEMTFGGVDMEKFVFRSAEQSFYALLQIIYSLAIAEDVYQFEHRDLHWGNVLIAEVKHRNIKYKIKDKTLSLPTKGVQITIIDYTLSRITYRDCCYYNDLSSDGELFTATGDYQFEIYRMMRAALNDKWDSYKPKTNIFWISYIISKMLHGVTYKSAQTKIHSQYLNKLRELRSSILTYESCMDYIINLSL